MTFREEYFRQIYQGENIYSYIYRGEFVNGILRRGSRWRIAIRLWDDIEGILSGVWRVETGRTADWNIQDYENPIDLPRYTFVHHIDDVRNRRESTFTIGTIIRDAVNFQQVWWQ